MDRSSATGVIRNRGAPSSQGSLKIPSATRSAAKSPYEVRSRGLVRMTLELRKRRASSSREGQRSEGQIVGANCPEGQTASFCCSYLSCFLPTLCSLLPLRWFLFCPFFHSSRSSFHSSSHSSWIPYRSSFR